MSGQPPYRTAEAAVRKIPFAGLIAAVLAASLFAASPSDNAAHAQTAPAVAVDLSPSGPVTQGTAIAVTMSFSNLEADADTSDTDYIFRADVKDSENGDADECEGGGMGLDRYMYKVDEDPEVRSATVSADCPPGVYTLRASVSSPDNIELASASVGFAVVEEPTIVVVPPPEPRTSAQQNADVTLVSNTAATSTDDLDIGNADTGDPTIRAQSFRAGSNPGGYNLTSVGLAIATAPTDLANFTVTIREASGNDPSDTVLHPMTNPASLTTGVNTFTAPADAKLETGETYFVHVEYTGSEAAELASIKADAEDSGAADGWSIGNESLRRTTTTWATSDASLRIEVTGSDAAASTDATLSALTLTDPTDAAVALTPAAFSPTHLTYTAGVAYAQSPVTVTATKNDDTAADPVIKLGGTVDSDGVVDLAVGSNTITVEVTAQDTTTINTYTLTVTRGAASTDATLSALALTDADGTAVALTPAVFSPTELSYTASIDYEQSPVTVAATKNDDTAADPVVKLGGTVDDGVVDLAVGENTVTVEVTAQDGTTTKTYTITVTRAKSTDATLSGLAVIDPADGSDVPVLLAFSPTQLAYTAAVEFRVEQVTVAPTRSQDGARVEYLDSSDAAIADADTDTDGKQVSLERGENVIKIKVTAQDTTTTRTYTLTITRKEPILVSNTGEAVSTIPGPVGGLSWAQAFSSGTNLGGYKLEGVGLEMAAVPGEPAKFVVTIRAAGSNRRNPPTDTIVYTLTNPAAFTANSVNTFAAPAGAELDAATQYFVHLAYSGAEPYPTVHFMDGGGEDISDAASWTIANGAFFNSGAGWEVFSPEIRLQVKGTPALASDADASVYAKLAANRQDFEVRWNDPGGCTSEYQVYAAVVDGQWQAMFSNVATTTTSQSINFDPPLDGSLRVGVWCHADPVHNVDEPPVRKLGEVQFFHGGEGAVAPTVPRDVDVTPSISQMTVRWDAPSNEYKSTLVEYQVQWKSGSQAYDAANRQAVTNLPPSTTVVIDGLTSNTAYTLRVRAVTSTHDGAWAAATGATLPSTDATLSALTLSDVTLSPVFDSDTTTYTASVANTVISTTVTATANHAGATVVITPADADGDQVKLKPGETEITVVVTAEDGITTETYTVTVERAKATVTITAAVAEAGEGHNPVFTVTRDPVADEPLAVKVEISETGAFVIPTQEGIKTVTIPAGQASASYTVGTPIGDAAWDAHSTVTAAVQASDTYDVGDPGSAQTRLLDDDLPVIHAKITVSPNPVVEGGTVTVTVTFDTDREPHGTATREVTLNTTAGTAATSDDFEALTNRLVRVSAADFSLVGSRYEAAKTETITTIDDSADEGDETFNVVMTKPSGERVLLRAPTELTVTIRVSDRPTDATLSGLALIDAKGKSAALSPTFASGAESYTAAPRWSQPRLTVTPTENHAEATVAITPDDADTVAEGHQVDLEVGTAKTVTVTVTAADGTTMKTYTVTITRQTAWTDATLSGLTVADASDNNVALSPTPFASATEAYTGDVGNRDTRVTVTPVTNDEYASVQYYAADGATLRTDADVNTAGHQLDLGLDDNVIKVQVTAEDATTTKTYTLTITRARPTVTITPPALPSGEGQPVTFTVTRDPAAPETLTVKLDISESADADFVAAADEGEKTVTIAANDTSATYDVETIPDDTEWDKNSMVTATLVAGDAYTLGDPKSATQEVQDDDFPVSTAVMSISTATVDEGESVTVTVTVTTDADQVPQSNGGTITISTLDGTAKQQEDYEELMEDHRLDPNKFKAVTVNGNSRYQAVYTSTVKTVNDADKEDDETFLVTRTKSLTATKITLDPPQSLIVTIRTSDRSTDATLSGLTLSGVTLSPVFDGGTVTYTGSAGYGVESTTVTATKNDAFAGEPVIKLNGVEGDDGTVSLAVGGSNVITVEVTAEDGSAKTYTVTVTRAAASTDATLSNLELSEVTLSPAFTSAGVTYTGSAAYNVATTTVAATTAHAEATVAITPVDADAETGGHQVGLAVGETTVRVTVTAEDDSTKTYTLTVTRDKPTVTISAAAGTVNEGGTVTFTVSRAPAAVEALDVKLVISETVDFVAAANEGEKTVTIAANQTSVTHTVATVADDGDWDAHSSIKATLQADAAYTLTASPSVSKTVWDDDFSAATAVLAVSPSSVDEGGTVTVTLTVTTNADQMPHGENGGTITISTTDGTASQPGDYEALSQSHTLASADFRAVTVGSNSRYRATYESTVSTVDDTDSEGAEAFTVMMEKTNAPKVTLDTPTSRSVTIPANDHPQSSDATLSGLTLSGVSLNEPFDSGTTTYTADVGRTELSTTTVTATPTDAGATAVIKLGEVVKTGGTVDLGDGDTVITVEVTAAGGATNTYTVRVTRHADADDDAAPLPIISTVECPDTPNPSVCDLDNELGKSEGSPVDGEFNIVVHFAEGGFRPDYPVHGFVSSDITATNATVSDYVSKTSDCWCYRFLVKPTGTSGETVQVTLSIAANVLVDRGGNANLASKTLTVWATVPVP